MGLTVENKEKRKKMKKIDEFLMDEGFCLTAILAKSLVKNKVVYIDGKKEDRLEAMIDDSVNHCVEIKARNSTENLYKTYYPYDAKQRVIVFKV